MTHKSLQSLNLSILVGELDAEMAQMKKRKKGEKGGERGGKGEVGKKKKKKGEKRRQGKEAHAPVGEEGGKVFDEEAEHEVGLVGLGGGACLSIGTVGRAATHVDGGRGADDDVGVDEEVVREPEQ